MATASLRQRIYDSYARGPDSLVRRLHRRWFTSPHTARLLFGMKVLPAAEDTYYYDLTTLLMLPILQHRVRRAPDQQILEIGVGYFALLAGKLAQLAEHAVDAVDLDRDRADSSRRHVELNRVAVQVYQSDLFAALPAGKRYDLIFWNLPYYRDPSGYLANLFAQVSDHLTDRGELVIGYNSKPLSRAAVDTLLAATRLRVTQTHTWWWNLHHVLVIRP
jgi:protein-L-isoaspartate O-methyltransferase